MHFGFFGKAKLLLSSEHFGFISDAFRIFRSDFKKKNSKHLLLEVFTGYFKILSYVLHYMVPVFDKLDTNLCIF